MSVEAMAWVLNHSTTTGTARLVLLGLANHAGPDGRDAWPSVDTLARYARVNRRNVQRALRLLEEGGHVLVEVGMGGRVDDRGDRRSNRYRIVLDGAAEAPPRADLRGGAGGATGRRSGSDGAAEAPPEPSGTVHQPPIELAPATPAPKPSRRCQLPDPFLLTPAMKAWAAETVPYVEARAETQQFADHHRAKGSLMKDWQAAWRTWMRNAAKFDAQASRRPGRRVSNVEESWRNIIDGPTEGIR